MTSERALRGTASESIAAEYLQARGLEVIARNLRCKSGELDLVCRDGRVLAVVEVRQRSRADHGGALCSVSASKQRKIIRAARFLLERRATFNAMTLRFDVVAIQGMPDGPHAISWIKDAFRAA